MTALVLYRAATWLARPILDDLIRRRMAEGKEDPDRVSERRGVPSRPRPDGPLIWLHAASVGEAQSALSLIGRLVATAAKPSVLVTTGTVTSARLLATRLPEGSFHQFVPLDVPAWVGRFLDHWRPDLALWMESELWPNMLTGLKRRGVPVVLINASMSAHLSTNGGVWHRSQSPCSPASTSALPRARSRRSACAGSARGRSTS